MHLIEPWGWLWVVFWAAALLAAVWLVVRSPARAPREDALAILRARFARGELSQEEFERARAVLLAEVEELK